MTEKMRPTNEERKIMEDVSMQIKVACEKLKEAKNATELHVAKMLQEMAVLYYSE